MIVWLWEPYLFGGMHGTQIFMSASLCKVWTWKIVNEYSVFLLNFLCLCVKGCEKAFKAVHVDRFPALTWLHSNRIFGVQIRIKGLVQEQLQKGS